MAPGTPPQPPGATPWKLLYLAAAALAALPSLLAWFRKPFLITFHEFDFLLGLFEPVRVLTPLPLLMTGRIIFFLLFLTIALAYTRWILLECRRPDHPRPADRLWIAAACIVFLPVTPWYSPDVFFYFGTGWIQSAHAMNPYTALISQAPDFPGHPLYENILPSWNHIITPYGPLFVRLAAVITAVCGGDPIACLWLLKVFCLAAHLLNGCIAGRIAREMAWNSRAVRFAFWLNPAFLFCYVSRAHNDIFMLTFLLAAIWAALTQRTALSAAALAVGAAFKYVPLLMAPAFFIGYLGGKWSPRRLLFLTLLGLGFCALVLTPSFLYPDGLRNFRRLFLGIDQLTVNFLYALLYHYVMKTAVVQDMQFCKMLLKGIFLAAYGALLLRLLLRGTRLTWQDVFTTLVWMFLFYFTVGSPEIHEWYFGWMAPFFLFVNRWRYFTYACILTALLPALAVFTGPRVVLSTAIGWVSIFMLLWWGMRWLTFRDARHSPLATHPS